MRFVADDVLVTSMWANQEMKDKGLISGYATIVEHSFDEDPYKQLQAFAAHDSKLAKAVKDKHTLVVGVTNQSVFDDLFVRLVAYHAQTIDAMYIVHMHSRVALADWQDENSATVYKQLWIEKLESHTISAMRSEVESLIVMDRTLLVKMNGTWQALPDSSFDDSLIDILFTEAGETLDWMATTAKCELAWDHHVEICYSWLRRRIKHLAAIYLK